MGNMLRFELRRLLKKPSFYVCLGLCMAFVLLTVIASKMSFDSMADYYRRYAGEFDDSGTTLVEQFAEQFSPEMRALNASGNYIMVIVLAVFSGIFVCEDRVRGTIKNIYARGYSRTSVFFAKYILTTAVALTLSVLMTLASYLSGVLIFATSGFNAAPIHVKGFALLILGNLLSILAVNTFYFMLSELIGTTGFSIAANIFAPGFISTAFSVLFGLIMLFGQGDSYEHYQWVSKVMEYWIYNLAMGGFSVNMELGDYIGHLIACAVYIAGFGVLSWVIVRKKEVKN